MRKIFVFLALFLSFSVSALTQETSEKIKPTEKDKTEAIPTNGYLKRGEPIGNSKKVSLAKIMANPQKYAGKKVIVEGVIVRSCKTEGCWLELAPSKEAKSVRVKMKDHAFFIPLNSAGAFARVEGILNVKTLSKEEVRHMIEDDGAKFDKINPDGTVTEISFEATGVELTMKK
jgi:putative transposon-encoded protein